MKTRYRNVYVLAPYNHATGGVELAHQLVDFINVNGGNAYIVYEKDGQIVPDAGVTPRYADYEIRVTSTVEDSAENMLVLPEVYFDWMYRYNAIDFGLWWMSVDNHFKSCLWSDSLKFYRSWKLKLKYSYLNLKYGRRNSLAAIRNEANRIYHFYQSVYAQNFLYRSGMNRVLPLGDYINPEVYSTHKSDEEREDIVLYNPAKGYEYTRRLIRANPDITFVPLVGLSREQLNDYMHRAKVYIDFGHFPGKDRLPREAVMNGLCIITGTAGASGYYEDVSISSCYKFHATRRNIPAISQVIRSIFADFQNHTRNFDTYRERIAREKEQFGEQIINFFFINEC